MKGTQRWNSCDKHVQFVIPRPPALIATLECQVLNTIWIGDKKIIPYWDRSREAKPLSYVGEFVLAITNFSAFIPERATSHHDTRIYIADLENRWVCITVVSSRYYYVYVPMRDQRKFENAQLQFHRKSAERKVFACHVYRNIKIQ